MAATPPSTSSDPSDNPVPVPSRSKKKIALAKSTAASCQPGSSSTPPSFLPASSAPPQDMFEDYHFIKMKNLMRSIGAFSCCGIPLTIREDRRQRRGFVSKLDIFCSVCENPPPSRTPMTVKIFRLTPELC